MKAFILLALLAVVASVACARHEFGGGYEQYCEEQQLALATGSCREYLRQPCAAAAARLLTWPWRRWGMSSCQALRQQCCQQLAQVEPRCRCKAVCRAFFGGSQLGQMSRARQMAKALPSTCNMYPSYCNIPTTGTCY